MPDEKLQRDILPIPDRKHVGLTTFDAKDPNTKYPPIEPLRPPKGAPNVLVVLLDDVGFGASSAFGGPVSMATAERLAAGLFRRRRHREPHHRPFAHAGHDRDRTQYRFYVQRQGGRSQANWSQVERPLCSRRQYSAPRQSDAGERATDRRRE